MAPLASMARKEVNCLNKTTIHCKTTAPMFMAGTDKDRPEMRAPSIKGNMRFIWRAIQRADDINKLREVEGSVFGNAFGGNSTKASDMRIRIEKMNVAKGSEPMVPHRTLQEYSGRGPFSGQAIREGGEFDVVITSFADEKTHIDFIRLFAATCLLYGFGRRSRKGFGTVKIKGFDGIGNTVYPWFAGAANNLNALSRFGAEYSYVSETEIAAISAKSPANYPYIESIRIAGSKGFPENMDIIKQIGMAVHIYSRKEFLGSASPRFASSILLSTAPWNDVDNCCIVTQLYCTNTRIDAEDRKNFHAELDGRV